MLHITAPAGTRAFYLGPLGKGMERELLLPRDTAMIVEDVYNDSSGIQHIHATLVP